MYTEPSGKLVNTKKKIYCEFGRSGGDFKCTRAIYRDENGTEFIRHNKFINGVAPLDILYPHMTYYEAL